MKTLEAGYDEKLRKRKRQVQGLVGQVTEVNNFVQRYYQRYNLANYRRREPMERMENERQAGLGIVAAMFLRKVSFPSLLLVLLFQEASEHKVAESTSSQAPKDRSACNPFGIILLLF